MPNLREYYNPVPVPEPTSFVTRCHIKPLQSASVVLCLLLLFVLLVQDLQPTLFLSFLTVHLQVVFGCPLFLPLFHTVCFTNSHDVNTSSGQFSPRLSNVPTSVQYS